MAEGDSNGYLGELFLSRSNIKRTALCISGTRVFYKNGEEKRMKEIPIRTASRPFATWIYGDKEQA